MKVLIIGNRKRYEKFYPQKELLAGLECIFCDLSSDFSEIIEKGKEAEILFVDAIGTVNRTMIDNMSMLKMIHSEGVAYNGIDLQAANERGIFVCNNKGANAGAVAEQAIMLMLELLRKGISGDQAVREGKQIETKEYYMVHGITELGQCKVGFVGFGDIAKATAKRLAAFGCEMFYYTPQRKPDTLEEEYSVTYLELQKLIQNSDIISIHCAVTEKTKGLVNRDFLASMKKTALLINTARGEIIDNEALREAILQEKIAGAGLDTIDPEPTPANHPLVDWPKEYQDRVALAPHLGGITTGSFQKAHRNMWENAQRVKEGMKPINVVNKPLYV